MNYKNLIKPAWWWLRNTDGKKDASLTIMVAAFVITTFAYLTSLIETFAYGNFNISFNDFSVDYATTVLIPSMTLYFGRRFSAKKQPKEKELESENEQ
jgi:hypothetical protein